VETWANVPLIVKNGAGWYGEVGTENSKGTKIFSLAGKVNNTGLVEVPIGATVKEVIFDIGGGIPKGRQFKAVQMGGPAGGCVPAQFLNLSIDYDTVQRIGAIMGSGGMVVMDENNCMVEIARFFLSFTQSESCGKCAPCRLGTTQLLETLTRITRGEGRMEDIDTIRELGETLTEASLCGLGQACSKPALSTLKYFLKEYEDHIQEMFLIMWPPLPTANTRNLLKSSGNAIPSRLSAVASVSIPASISAAVENSISRWRFEP